MAHPNGPVPSVGPVALIGGATLMRAWAGAARVYCTELNSCPSALTRVWSAVPTVVTKAATVSGSRISAMIANVTRTNMPIFWTISTHLFIRLAGWRAGSWRPNHAKGAFRRRRLRLDGQ